MGNKSMLLILGKYYTQCRIAQMHNRTNAQMHKCSNAQMHKCTNPQMHRCTNAQTHKCTNAQMLKCSNAQSHKCTTTQMHECSSNAQMHNCQMLNSSLLILPQCHVTATATRFWCLLCSRRLCFFLFCRVWVSLQVLELAIMLLLSIVTESTEIGTSVRYVACTFFFVCTLF